MEIKSILLSLKQNKFMASIMVLQIAFTMAVLSLSVLLAAATLKEWNLPSGIPHDDIIRVTPRFYDPNMNVAAAVQHDLQRLQAIDGVQAVSPTDQVPFAAEVVRDVYLSVEEEAQSYKTNIFSADEKLLKVLDLTLIAGRAFTFSDVIADPDAKNSEVMISQSMAKALFDNGNALDKTVWLNKGSDPVKIVGIYSDFMNGETLNYFGKSYQTMILPRSSWQFAAEPHYLLRMTPGLAVQKLEDIATVFYQEQGRYLAVYERLSRIQKRMYDGRGSRALTFLVISLVLVLITSFGIAGFTSFQVNQRRKQIGIRRALGGRKSDIMAYFLTENSIITFAGLLLGTVVTLFFSFELSTMEQQNILDLVLLMVIALLLWFINVVAVWLPGRRAVKVPPAIVTRGS
ncbi:ABC transporter permease [Planctobacterium marinum]|uniref:ABC transporter permease n=1 Tax=Planctobacterium marinum TaxID=1631968 RepID=UPI001E4DCFFF|nr:FtsX-like permease family protein [Planctobacterium marinum]MCC2605188.1 ABC transporter permease [Planctobacterium marinum]